MNKSTLLKNIMGAGAVLCLLGIMTSRQQFFISYLFGFLFWFGIAIGCLGLWLLHEVTGGAWGDVIKPLIEAGAMTLPVLALLFLPLLAGLSTLYPWAATGAGADALLAHKHLYLNVPFFLVRTFLYFGLWSWMVFRLRRWSARKMAGDTAAGETSARHSAMGLILYVFSLTFASIDWTMSLEPAWYSTIYGVMIMTGQVLSAFAFVIFALFCVRSPDDLHENMPVKPYSDLGNMVLAFVMIWAYLSLSQYLVIWSANIPEEIPWYLHRQAGGWFWVAMTLIAFQFFLPFFVLLGRRNKQRIERLAAVALLLLGVRLIEVFWLVEPAVYPLGFHLHWLDAIAPVTIGAAWIAAFRTQLYKLPSPIGAYIPESES